MLSSQPRQRGFILTEAFTALALIGLVLGAATVLLIENSRATEQGIDYRKAQLAAESCIERMRAGTMKVADADVTDENNVVYRIRVTQAASEWEPLRRVSVAATITSGKGRAASYTIIAYIAEPPSPGEKGS